MAQIQGSLVHAVGYAVLGILFFLVVWSMTEEAFKSTFGRGIACALGLVVGASGLFPLWPPLKMGFILLAAFSALMGTVLSRMRLVANRASRGRVLLTLVAFGLMALDALLYVVPEILKRTPSSAFLGDLISWALLVYALSGDTRGEVISPVTEMVGLPRSGWIVVAFILASVVFLPVEFPFLDPVLTIVSILTGFGTWVWSLRSFYG